MFQPGDNKKRNLSPGKKTITTGILIKKKNKKEEEMKKTNMYG